MDLTDTIAPTSDQLDAVDLLSGPRTFTIDSISKGNAEQPVNIKLVEFPRVWRPGKSMRRVLVACWGADGSKYVGRRVTLYCDPKVQFGGQAVGGTRISHLSHLDRKKQVPLLVTRGKSAIFVVEPLVETTEDRVAEYKREWKTATEARRKVIEREVAALTKSKPSSTAHAAEEPRPEAPASPEPEENQSAAPVEEEVDPEQFEAEDVDDDPTDPNDPDLTAHEQEGAEE
ncbi:hypothetical protein ACIBCH_20865 [Amycolatopsis thailandensis]|uniref:hypothetical protein n=1 Tax=Amycolatopsis thailandensis TaxID=589330 RepID=UPI00379EAD83